MRLNKLLNLNELNPEQLTNPKDVHALAWRVECKLIDSELSKSTVDIYMRYGISMILQAHIERDVNDYTESLTFELVKQKRHEYEQGFIQRQKYQNLRKASAWFSEMYHTGTITFGTLPNWNHREPTPEFAKLLRFFCDDSLRTGLLGESSVNNVKSGIRQFLFELELRGRFTFDDITLAEVNDAITNLASNYSPAGLQWLTYSIRVFLVFLHESEIVDQNLSIAIPENLPGRKMFYEGFTTDEIKILLAEPDCTTSIGKRDYAIMLLAVQTGLRVCDIANLKRSDIDWHKKEISIIQQKTAKPLILPLPIDSAIAIGNYLLNARPKCDLPYIFLCHTGILRPIKRRSASAIATRIIKRSGITSDIQRRGFHSFRRAYGTRLLQSEIPFDLLRQLLGQVNPDSIKPYLSVEEQGLKNCALSLITLERVNQEAQSEFEPLDNPTRKAGG